MPRVLETAQAILSHDQPGVELFFVIAAIIKSTTQEVFGRPVRGASSTW